VFHALFYVVLWHDNKYILLVQNSLFNLPNPDTNSVKIFKEPNIDFKITYVTLFVT